MMGFNNKGFTLIEIIVSIAILAILVVATLSLTAQGFTGIYRAGNKSKQVFNSSNLMEATIGGIEEDEDSIKRDRGTLTFKINGENVTLSGEIITIESEDKLKLKSFLCDYPSEN